MTETATTDQPQPECWCAYGNEGTEFTRFPHPGCPAHDPQNTPPQTPDADDEIECETCRDGWEDCGNCDGSGDDMDAGTAEGCYRCGGSGEVIPSHCCACGGSPYCNCCSKCGASCVAKCRCPITVQMADGSTRTV
jgi:hypothetical protein